MINQYSIDFLRKMTYSRAFIRPAYGSYCFAHLPDTLLRLFGVQSDQPLPAAALPAWQGYDRVVLFLVDAFGWRFFEQHAGSLPFLQEVQSNGLVSQLTSQFPSTTSAHITSIHTGLPVGESGVFEWFYYEPEADAVISPLLYSLATVREREYLRQIGIPAHKTLPPSRFYGALQAAGVRSTIFQPREYAFSTYSQHVRLSAEAAPYITWSEALVNLERLIECEKSRAYYFLYFPNIDTLGHTYGPRSIQVRAEIETFFLLMERFLSRLSKLPGRTLLLLTADHGLSETDPNTTVYLNRRFPALERMLQVDRMGRPLRFGGSPRDLFLYVRDEHIAEAQAMLREGLEDKMEVVRTEELVQAGLFGSVTPRLLERLGNLVVLPYLGESAFWYEKGVFEQHYYGHHGGLTPEEMLIPLVAMEV